MKSIHSLGIGVGVLTAVLANPVRGAADGSAPGWTRMCADDARLMALQVFDLEQAEVDVVVLKSSGTVNALPKNWLCFVRPTIESEPIFRAETVDNLVSVFRLSDEESLIYSLWTTGSAYRVRVFSISQAKVLEVLDAGSKQAPMFVRDQSGQPIILLSEDGVIVRRYIWNGKGFQPLAGHSVQAP